jgi:alcohol dehydrogenase (NADP+)
MIVTNAYAASAACAPLEPFQIERREPRPNDVLFDILYCGICHTDVHLVRGEFPGPIFPMVPGHEIVGRVVNIGAAVRRFVVGDLIGVGCIVDSCRHCSDCALGEEHFCDGMISTYNAYEADGKTRTFGGFSTRMTVDQAYVLKIPPSLDPARAATLLCAGITTYSPLRHWNVGKGTKIGIVGLGGLGHIAVKLAVALGAEVTVFSTSERKRHNAGRLGAADFANTTRLGSVVLILAASMTAPYFAAIATQMMRIEGRFAALSITEVVAGTGVYIFVVLPALLFSVAAFRPDRSPDLILLLNDMAWMIFVMAFGPAIIQNFVIGIAILSDRNKIPSFPRWLGYFNLWVGLLFMPGGMITFFKSGPFAWNGFIAFWIPAGIFGIWFMIMTPMLLKAIKHQEADVATAILAGTASKLGDARASLANSEA